MQILLYTHPIRAKAIATSELLLFSKLGIITELEPGRGTTTVGNPEGRQGIEGDLHVEVISDSPSTLGWRRRGPSDLGKPAIVYKSEKRKELEDEGYTIHGSSGDQWSDLSGLSTASRSFKLPNPMYYIA